MGKYQVKRDKADTSVKNQYFSPITPDDVRAKNREYYRVNAEKLRAKSRKYYADNKEKVKAREKLRGAIYRERYRHVVKATHERQWRELRTITLQSIGGAICVRCGFSDYRALHIDHINGGGGKHRDSFSSNKSYHHYVRKNPHEFQVLCANCNSIKRYTNNELPTGKRLSHEL